MVLQYLQQDFKRNLARRSRSDAIHLQAISLSLHLGTAVQGLSGSSALNDLVPCSGHPGHPGHPGP